MAVLLAMLSTKALIETQRRKENRPYWLNEGIYVILENPVNELECVALIQGGTLMMCELGGVVFDGTGFYTYGVNGWETHLDVVSAFQYYSWMLRCRSSIEVLR